MESGRDCPMFSFGVIADVQYADIPDGHSFYGVPRFYRHSLQILDRAVNQWSLKENLKFAINLGDIVDGKCPKDQSISAINRTIAIFDRLRRPSYHLIGNHCLYNLPREKLLPLLKIQSPNCCAYYDFSPVPEFRFIMLDGYDVSAIGWPRDDPRTLQAMGLLNAKNPNLDKNSPPAWSGLEQRFVMYNGGIGEEQMKWLERVLKEATERQQKVVVCCHLPMDPGASNGSSLLWNFEEVMNVIHRYDCVKVCLSGHDHFGRYCVDSHGVHHRSLEATLECPPPEDAFGHVDVYHDRMLLVGTGRVESTEMRFLR